MKRTTALALTLAPLVLAPLTPAPLTPALSAATGVSAADEGTRPELAVLRGENPTQNPWWDELGAEKAQRALIARLDDGVQGGVMARQELVEILARKRLWLTGRLSPAGAIRMGRELGVRYLVVTTLAEFGTGARGLGKKSGRKLLGLGGPKYFNTQIALRLVDSKDGRTVWSDSRSAQTSLSELVSSPSEEGARVEEAVFESTVLRLLEEMAAQLSAASALVSQRDGRSAEVRAEESDF